MYIHLIIYLSPLRTYSSNGASSIPNIHIPYNQIITFDAIAAVAEKDAAKYIAVTIKSPIIRFGNIESNDLSFETYSKQNPDNWRLQLCYRLQMEHFRYNGKIRRYD